ncbi:MAG: hypothetical protein WBN90_01695 [Gammaproteobacteria bacterium]
MTPTTTMFLTLVICTIIIVLLIYFLNKPNSKTVSTAPSILTGIGIFGTFLGVTISLLHFNPDDIVASVPIFISGIKLAFATSVVGIAASLIHKLKFSFAPLQEETIQDEMEVSTVDSLTKMTHSLNSIENMMGANESRVNRGELTEFLDNFGEKLEAGLISRDQGDQELVSEEAIKADEAVLAALKDLKDELAKNSLIEQNIAKDQMQRLLGELKEGVVAADRQTESLLEVFSGLKDRMGAGDPAVVTALNELKEELGKTSVDQQNILKDQMQGLMGELKEGVMAGSRQAESLVDVFTGLKERMGTEDQAVVAALGELKEELARTSVDEQNIVRDQMQSLLGELKEGVVAGGKQTESILEVFTGLKDFIAAQDQAVIAGLNELKQELAKGSLAEQTIVRDQMQGLLGELKEDAVARALQTENLLEVFKGLKEDIGGEAEKAREVSAEQMESLFSGLSQAAAGTLGDMSELASNLVSQTKWQASTLAKEISAANEISTKSMIAMLKEIVIATEDANLKIITELGKLRGDVAADLKATNEQSTALLDQLRVMTDSYKASLISTVTDLKAQITKDMKANYNLIDTYTKAVADVTGTNQVEALERMEAIANIMQGVVQSSSDMSSLLHENAAAMNRMQDAFTGTNEGSLGRFLLEMNENLIEHVSSLQNSLDAQGSLGTLMQDMNNETNLRLKAMEKAFESSVFEIKQLPQEFVRGMSKLDTQGRKN